MPKLRVLITTGPTREAIDPVRYLSNDSSGKQGVAIARAFLQAGAAEPGLVDVVLVAGPLSDPALLAGLENLEGRCQLVHVITAEEMLAASLAALPVDVAICVAAVCDYRPKIKAAGKVRKAGNLEGQGLTLELIQNPDILHRISTHTTLRPRLVVGFAAETENLVENAQEKLRRKRCDMILANGISPTAPVFGAAENQVTLITRDAVSPWPRMPKEEVAERLVAMVYNAISS